jgi:hypothetical protein
VGPQDLLAQVPRLGQGHRSQLELGHAKRVRRGARIASPETGRVT